MRPLGVPTLRDRVVQMAVKLTIEPICQANFCAHSYGFRPKRSAHDAVDDIASTLWAGYTQVIDADLSKYFDSIPHAKLMAVVAERIVDGGILALIQHRLKAPVIGEDANGTRKTVGGGKANHKGTPQGGVNYFHYRNSNLALEKVKVHAEQPLRKHLMKRHNVKTRGIVEGRFPSLDLCRRHGLYKVPTAGGWKSAHAFA